MPYWFQWMAHWQSISHGDKDPTDSDKIDTWITSCIVTQDSTAGVILTNSLLFCIRILSGGKKSAPYSPVALYMDKVRKFADSRRCALLSGVHYSSEITVVPALNYAVSRQLPSDLEGSTGHRSRCYSCPICGCLSTCTRKTPCKGASIKKGDTTQSSHRQGSVSHIRLSLKRQHWCVPDTVPPIQILVWKLVLQSGRSWLMGDQLLPSGNGVLLNSRTPNLSGLVIEGDASRVDVQSTHRLLFQWGKGGSCQTLPPLGRNGSSFLSSPSTKIKHFNVHWKQGKGWLLSCQTLFCRFDFTLKGDCSRTQGPWWKEPQLG